MEPNGETFGVYVHWPFCAAKCPYCDFNSHVRHGGVDQAMFVQAYAREIAHMASLSKGRSVSSIFFGGGTPSLMEGGTVAAILEAIGKHWTIQPDAEITLEANPTSVEAGRFQDYRAAGVNRVSLGVQSLDNAQLRFLGRLHTAEEAIEAIRLARSTFDRISFDLIYSRPGQRPGHWRGELGRALELAADHLSLYQLTIEQGTPFFDLQARGKLEVPPADDAADLYEITRELTTEAGLPAYEISNHAAESAQCRHNLVYWRYGEYAGIGPGAHGRLLIDGERTATATMANPEEWWQSAMAGGHGMDECETLNQEAAGDEMLLMGLRLKEGIDPKRYLEICGRQLDPARLAFLTEQGLVETTAGGRLRATPQGFLLLDAVVADLAA